MPNRRRPCLQWAALRRAGIAMSVAAFCFGPLGITGAAAQDDDPGVFERLKDSARDKVIYLQIHSELQKFEMYQKYDRHFEADYSAFIEDIVETKAYNDPALVSQKAQAFTTTVRQENAYLVYRAGDEANRKILQDRLDTVLLMKAEQGDAVCGRYGALGPLGVDQAVLIKYLPRISVEADAILEAMIAGKNSDVRVEPMEGGDMEAFIQYMYDTGVTLEQMELLGSTTGTEEGYCDTVVAYYGALLGFEGAAAQRVRASTNFETARN